MNPENNSAKTCACPHHRAVPIVAILFGLTFLLGALNVLTSSVVDIVWPILVIVAAGIKLGEKNCTCC